MGCISAVFYFLTSWFISFVAIGGIAGLIFGEEAMGSTIVGILSFLFAIFLWVVILIDNESRSS